MGYLVPKLSLYKNINYRGVKGGVNIFSNVIRPKVNVISRLEYELADFRAVVQHFGYYATETISSECDIRSIFLQSTTGLNSEFSFS